MNLAYYIVIVPLCMYENLLIQEMMWLHYSGQKMYVSARRVKKSKIMNRNNVTTQNQPLSSGIQGIIC